MSSSKVYFTDLRAKNGDNLLQKLQRLIKTAGIGNIDFENKYLAIKIHFGEPGNPGISPSQLCKSSSRCSKRTGRKTIPYRLQYSVCRGKEKRSGPSGQC